MYFPSNLAPNYKTTFIMLNHTAPSLYSILREGIMKTMEADLSTTKLFPWSPSSIQKSCFIQGFNLNLPNPWSIKSRIGIQSQSLAGGCFQPYLVRGVGIGFHGNSNMSCGEIIIDYRNPGSYPPIKTYPAFCRIYIQ